jgi:lipoate---protein ligase
MRCILSPSNDAWFNLAAEEFLFRNYGNDLLFLYINAPSVVVGKHQNALAEVNYTFVNENRIKVVRRISGGGAVYHDWGNLNFSFHKTVDDTAKVSFRMFSEPIAEVLVSMGVPAEINSRNDIVVNGFKVSGHAEHVFRNRILSHGTLLFNANKEHLSQALKSKESHFSGKAIASVRSRVANLKEFLVPDISIEEFTQTLLHYFAAHTENGELSELTARETKQIETLVADKYSLWTWNFGYSPKYTFQNETVLPDGLTLGCNVHVEKGVIQQMSLSGNFFAPDAATLITEALKGVFHRETDIVQKLSAMLMPGQVLSLVQILF